MKLGNDNVSFWQWFNWQYKARHIVQCSLCGGKIYGGRHLEFHRKTCINKKQNQVSKK